MAKSSFDHGLGIFLGGGRGGGERGRVCRLRGGGRVCRE